MTALVEAEKLSKRFGGKVTFGFGPPPVRALS